MERGAQILYRRDELIGAAIQALLPARLRQRKMVRCEAHVNALECGAVNSGLSLTGLCKNGVEFTADATFSAMPTDEARLVLCIVRDGADRVRAGDMFRGLVEAASDAMVIVNNEDRIVLVNSQTERVFGYPCAELREESVEALIPERFRELHPAHRGSYFGMPRVRQTGVGLELYRLRIVSPLARLLNAEFAIACTNHGTEACLSLEGDDDVLNS